jgi:hypothetical protein
MNRLLLLPIAAAVLLMGGCYDEASTNAPAPPPPPYYPATAGNSYPSYPPDRSYPDRSYPDRPRRDYGREVPPLVRLGERNGFRAGLDDGARDAYYHAGYGPRQDRKFEDAPGYDYRLGPIPPYVEAFRRAYLRGYEQGFHGTAGGERER